MKIVDISFLKFKNYNDSVECIEHIKAERIMHINLTALDDSNAQRVVDFVSGALQIQGGTLINPSDKIYCSIPKGKLFESNYSSEITIPEKQNTNSKARPQSTPTQHVKVETEEKIEIDTNPTGYRR